MSGAELQHPILPVVDGDWIIGVSETTGTVTAFEAETLETLETLSSGPYIPEDEYASCDPRRWSRLGLMGLLHRYGVAGGSRFDGTIFTLGEVVALHMLMDATDDAGRQQIDRVDLGDAMAMGRSAYREFFLEHLMHHPPGMHCSHDD